MELPWWDSLLALAAFNLEAFWSMLAWCREERLEMEELETRDALVPSCLKLEVSVGDIIIELSGETRDRGYWLSGRPRRMPLVGRFIAELTSPDARVDSVCASESSELRRLDILRIELLLLVLSGKPNPPRALRRTELYWRGSLCDPSPSDWSSMYVELDRTEEVVALLTIAKEERIVWFSPLRCENMAELSNSRFRTLSIKSPRTKVDSIMLGSSLANKASCWECSVAIMFGRVCEDILVWSFRCCSSALRRFSWTMWYCSNSFKMASCCSW
jgi:hypothetical protein